MSDAKNIFNVFALTQKYLPTCEYYLNTQFIWNKYDAKTSINTYFYDMSAMICLFIILC